MDTDLRYADILEDTNSSAFEVDDKSVKATEIEVGLLKDLAEQTRNLTLCQFNLCFISVNRWP